MERILVINPGATSTKLAVFDGEQILMKKIVEHQGTELQKFVKIFDQYPYRMKLILEALQEVAIPLATLTAIVGRGGLLKPVAGGTYQVNSLMVEELKNAKYGEHASNLGAVLAYHIAQKLSIPAFIVDPVSTDEMEPVARVAGSPEFTRISNVHALNMKAVGRKVAADLGEKYETVNFIVAHLGTGITLSAQRQGKMIDIIDGRVEGPFSLDRCGSLSTNQLVRACYSGKYTYDELCTKLFSSGGLYAYLGTKDVRQVEKMALEGNSTAELLLEALGYQVAKAIGSLATVLKGKVDRIIFTGGIAHSQRVVTIISERVQFIAPIIVVPGEEEMEALAKGAARVLQGEERSQIYQ
jgi:butyrate kinase